MLASLRFRVCMLAMNCEVLVRLVQIHGIIVVRAPLRLYLS